MIQNLHWLVRLCILWHVHQMGLPQPHLQHQHARLYWQGTNQIPIPETHQTTTLPTQTHPDCFQCHPTTFTHWHITTTVTHQRQIPLSPARDKYIQDIVGTLLGYIQGVDPTLSTAISSIAAWQANSIQAVQQDCNQLLDYFAIHPHASLKLIASDMIHAVHTDASYLSEPNSKSWVAGLFPFTHHDDPNTLNAPILTHSSIIRHILVSTSKAELTDLFYHCKPSHSELPWKKWDTASYAPLSPPTTSLQKDVCLQQCNQKPPNP